MKPSQLAWSFIFLLSLTVGLAGCGDSDSSDDPTANSFPYGADSMTQTVDYDDDGNINGYSDLAFSYNSAMQMTGVTGTMDTFNEETGELSDRTIITGTYDPNITPVDNKYFGSAAISASQKSSPDPVFGALISLISETYKIDSETGELYANPSHRDEEHYTYSSSGVLLSYTATESDDNDNDGIVDSSRQDIKTYEYNADGDITLYSYSDSEDTDGDGTADSGYSRQEVYQYDTHGNLTSESTTIDSDGDGVADSVTETTYTNTYEDGLLTKTVVTGDSEYQIDYVYDDQGRIDNWTRSQDNNLSDDILDNFTTYSYIYDDAGRVVSLTEYYRYDSNNDDALDYWRRSIEEWTYNENGLVTLYHSEDSYDNAPADDAISSHSGYNYHYDYTDDGYMSLYGRESLRDADLDGTFESYYYRWSYEYSYDANGYLIGYTGFDEDYTDGVLSSKETETQTVTYENGTIMGAELIEDEDGDGQTDSIETITITYDDLDRAIRYSESDDYDNDGTADNVLSVDLTYNDDDSVDFSFSNNGGNVGSMEVNFSSVGIPVGSKDTVITERDAKYPPTPGVNHNLYMAADNNENEKVYIIKEKTPKILDFYLYTQGDVD